MFKFERNPHTDSQMRKLRQTTVKLALLIFFPSNGSKVGEENCKKLSIIIFTNWIINQYFFSIFFTAISPISTANIDFDVHNSPMLWQQSYRLCESHYYSMKPKKNDRMRASELMDERWPRTQTRECQRIPKLLEWKKNVKTMKNIYYTIIIFLREFFGKATGIDRKYFWKFFTPRAFFLPS